MRERPERLDVAASAGRAQEVGAEVGRLGDDELERDALDGDAHRAPRRPLHHGDDRGQAFEALQHRVGLIGGDHDRELERHIRPAARIARHLAAERRRDLLGQVARTVQGQALSRLGPLLLEPLQEALLGRRSDAAHLLQPPLASRGPQLVDGAHAEHPSDLEHPLRGDAQEAPQAHELRLDFSLELVQLRDRPGFDQLAEAGSDAGPDPAELLHPPCPHELRRPARGSRGSSPRLGDRPGTCSGRSPPGREAPRRRRDARRSPGCRAGWPRCDYCASALEKELDSLFAAPLDDFVAERDALAKRLRADGDRETADRVKALRKPSAAVWAVNQLARRQQKDYRALLAAGDRLRKAQEQVLGGTPPAKLQEAATAERELVDRLTEKGRALLEVAGHTPTDSMVRRVSGTLHAAATRPDLREAAESGRLEHEEETAGFGFELLSGGVPKAPQPKQGDDKRARERREAAEQRLEEAREELAAAKEAAKDAAAEVKRLTRELAGASTEEDRLAKEVERRERAVEAAETKLDGL